MFYFLYFFYGACLKAFSKNIKSKLKYVLNVINKYLDKNEEKYQDSINMWKVN